MFKEYWSPRIVGELNGQYVKLAKFKGEFMWHSHANEDELFLVVKGTLKIELKDETITLKEGEFYIVPIANSKSKRLRVMVEPGTMDHVKT